jgi:transitional endoplasmic reticulum ATPase
MHFMARIDETVRSLREALQQSPDNASLRRQLAEFLQQAGQTGEAEKEYRLALALEPLNAYLKVGLARAFFEQGKQSQALVVVEDLLKLSQTPAAAYLLHARLLLQEGEVDRAAHQYREAIDNDPALADARLADVLGESSPNLEDMHLPQPHLPDRSRDEPPEQLHAPVENPVLSFADVAGMEAVKEEVRLQIIHPLSSPHLFAAYGKPAGGGLLLFGPPGCGKTYLARATAGEVRAAFLTVGVQEALDLWRGHGQRNLHSIFQQARTHRPCVLFFDEIDALGAPPTDMRSPGQRPLTNQLLAELDGASLSKQGVLLLAATNAPWRLDPALRRPGRFDRILFVPPPDADARSHILRLLCRNKPLDTIDYDQVGRKTDGYSGADLKALVDVTVEKKLREALRDGVPRPLTTRDLLTATAAVKASTREWLATARNYALHANQGGVYDDLLKYLKL